MALARGPAAPSIAISFIPEPGAERLPDVPPLVLNLRRSPAEHAVSWKTQLTSTWRLCKDAEFTVLSRFTDAADPSIAGMDLETFAELLVELNPGAWPMFTAPDMKWARAEYSLKEREWTIKVRLKG